MKSKLLKNLVLTTLLSYSSGMFAKVVIPKSVEEYTKLYHKHLLVTLFSAEPLAKHKAFVEAAEKHPEYTFCFIDAHNKSLVSLLEFYDTGTKYSFSYKGIGIVSYQAQGVFECRELEGMLKGFKDSVAQRVKLEKDMANYSPAELHEMCAQMVMGGEEFFTRMLAIPADELFSGVKTSYDEKGNITSIERIPFTDVTAIDFHLCIENHTGMYSLVDVLKTTKKGSFAYNNAFELYKAYLRGSKNALEKYQSSGDERVDTVVQYNLNFIKLALDADSY